MWWHSISSHTHTLSDQESVAVVEIALLRLGVHPLDGDTRVASSRVVDAEAILIDALEDGVDIDEAAVAAVFADDIAE